MPEGATPQAPALCRDMDAILERLREPFPAHLIGWRVGSRTADRRRGQALPFINARAVQDRLDEVVGPQNWKNSFVELKNGVLCRLSIRCNGVWVTKEDAAQYEMPETPADGEDANHQRELSVKGAHSDAFKRAAVMWGIGRYLYSVKPAWVDLREDGRWFAHTPRLPASMLPKASSHRSSRPPASASRASVPTPAPAPAAEPAATTSPVPAAKPTPTAPAPAASEPPIGTAEQWDALKPAEQSTVTVLLERIRKGLGLHSVSDYLNGRGKDLPEWLRSELLKRLAAKQNEVATPAAKAVAATEAA